MKPQVMSSHNFLAKMALSLVYCAVCHAQTSPPPPEPRQPTTASSPEIDTHDAPATFTSKVDLVLVRVVVRDRQGKAVGDLKREDFQLFDRRKPQIISKFLVEKGGGEIKAATVLPSNPPAGTGDSKMLPPPDRFIAYLFDDVHLSFDDLVHARDAAAHQIEASLRPNGRAAIFTTSGLTVLDFTDDVPKLQETLALLRPHPRSAAPGGCLSVYMADLIANRHDMGALAVATTTCGPNAAIEPLAMQILMLGEEETRLNLIVLRNVVRRMSAMPGERSIILASSGFVVPTDLHFDEGDVIDLAMRSNVVVNAVDARGLYVLEDASQPGSNPAIAAQRSVYASQEASAADDVMVELADGTGGTFIHNTNDLDGGFRRITAAVPEYYYLLGFSPQELKNDGSYHTLKVALRNPAYTLQARRGYFAPKRAVDPAERAKEELRDALYSRDELQDIPVDLQTQFFKETGVSAKLSVLARVDVRRLPFRKTDGRNCDTLTVVSGLFDRDGNLVAGKQKAVGMRLKDPTLALVGAAGLVVKTIYDVAPGTYAIRLVVRDSEGQIMAARNGAIEIP